MVDVSHLSDAGFADVCRVASRPFVAGHSCCRALCPHPRNATDEMIRAVGERGGVIGMALACGFLSAAYYETERVASDRFFRAVASGSAIGDYPRIEQLLRAAGLTSQQIGKVCYANLLRVFSEIID